MVGTQKSMTFLVFAFLRDIFQAVFLTLKYLKGVYRLRD
ncbi:Hypothetical protein AKI40_3699 [Enterobacter sp. FY-07]|nr:Hypothetical protein AKI40_3699 [Enterobacter sp. FY-07]